MHAEAKLRFSHRRIATAIDSRAAIQQSADHTFHQAHAQDVANSLAVPRPAYLVITVGYPMRYDSGQSCKSSIASTKSSDKAVCSCTVQATLSFIVFFGFAELPRNWYHDRQPIIWKSKCRRGQLAGTGCSTLARAEI